MNKYNFEVGLNEGYYCGFVTVEAENSDVAEDMALDYVCERLSAALPELYIEVSVRLMEEE